MRRRGCEVSAPRRHAGVTRVQSPYHSQVDLTTLPSFFYRTVTGPNAEWKCGHALHSTEARDVRGTILSAQDRSRCRACKPVERARVHGPAPAAPGTGRRQTGIQDTMRRNRAPTVPCTQPRTHTSTEDSDHWTGLYTIDRGSITSSTRCSTPGVYVQLHRSS